MIDWLRLNELREEVGEEDFSEVVDLFLEEVGEVIGRLETSVDPSRLEGDLHFLKGSALGLGFVEFANLCQKGELESAQGRTQTVDVSRILEIFYKSRETLLADMPRHFPA